MSDFTPVAGLIGGALIGTSAVILTRRVMGSSSAVPSVASCSASAACRLMGAAAAAVAGAVCCAQAQGTKRPKPLPSNTAAALVMNVMVMLRRHACPSIGSLVQAEQI